MRTHVLAAVSGAALLGLPGCGTAESGTPAAAPPAATSPAPATTSPAAAPPATTPAAEKTARGDGCPVDAATLQRVAGLPDGYRIKAADVKCSQGWATAGLTAPSPEQQGDGVLLFRYSAATGTWTKKAEGSDLGCADHGIPESTGLCSAGG